MAIILKSLGVQISFFLYILKTPKPLTIDILDYWDWRCLSPEWTRSIGHFDWTWGCCYDTENSAISSGHFFSFVVFATFTEQQITHSLMIAFVLIGFVVIKTARKHPPFMKTFPKFLSLLITWASINRLQCYVHLWTVPYFQQDCFLRPASRTAASFWHIKS